MFSLLKNLNRVKDIERENSSLVNHIKVLTKINKSLLDENESVREASFEYFKASKEADYKITSLEEELANLSKAYEDYVQSHQDDTKKLKSDLTVFKRKLTMAENKLKKLEGDN